jgi:hypothetical protein
MGGRVSDALANAYGEGTDEMLTPAQIEQRIRHHAARLKNLADAHLAACDELKEAEKAYGLKEAEQHMEIARLSPDLRAKDVEMAVRLACAAEWGRFIDAKSSEHSTRHRKQAQERILSAYEGHEKFIERVVRR